MRTPLIAAGLCLGLVTAATAAQAPGAPAPPPLPPGMTVTFETLEGLWGPGSEAVEPFRIVGNVYYVGARNIGVYLITTPEGHILLDTGTTRMIGSLPQNIEKLGFKLRDVKVLLTTHAHIDHVEGHNVMKHLTGARVLAMRGDAEALATGIDLSGTDLGGWAPVKVDRIIEDNEEVTLGGVTMRAILTPGHTPGATAWVLNTTEGDRSYQIVFGGGPTPVVGNVKYNTPAPLATTAFRRLRELKPDMVLSGHPEAAFRGKFDALRAGARPHPLQQEPNAWAMQINTSEANYQRKLNTFGASGTGLAPSRQ